MDIKESNFFNDALMHEYMKYVFVKELSKYKSVKIRAYFAELNRDATTFPEMFYIFFIWIRLKINITIENK